MYQDLFCNHVVTSTLQFVIIRCNAEYKRRAMEILRSLKGFRPFLFTHLKRSTTNQQCKSQWKERRMSIWTRRSTLLRSKVTKCLVSVGEYLVCNRPAWKNPCCCERLPTTAWRPGGNRPSLHEDGAKVLCQKGSRNSETRYEGFENATKNKQVFFIAETRFSDACPVPNERHWHRTWVFLVLYTPQIKRYI